MGAFLKGIQQFQKNTKIRVDDECRFIALTLFSSIVDLTPQKSNGAKYSKGWLVNNWRFEVNRWNTTMPTKFNSTVEAPLSSSQVQDRLLNLLKTRGIFYKDGFVSMLNKSIYADRAEELGWPKEVNPTDSWHYWTGNVQAYHMVGLSFLNLPQKYKS